MPRPRPLLVLVAALVAAVVAGCGNKESTVTEGATEAAYLDIGGLKYQVQISRLLNPHSRDDRAALIGLPPSQRLGREDQWFAVWIRVQNESSQPRPMASRYQISDTQGNVFRPITLGRDNVFAFRPGILGGDEIYPLANTPAAESSIQGSLLLFKIPDRDLENRPLEFEIRSPVAPGEVGKTALDV